MPYEFEMHSMRNIHICVVRLRRDSSSLSGRISNMQKISDSLKSEKSIIKMKIEAILLIYCKILQ